MHPRIPGKFLLVKDLASASVSFSETCTITLQRPGPKRNINRMPTMYCILSGLPFIPFHCVYCIFCSGSDGYIGFRPLQCKAFAICYFSTTFILLLSTFSLEAIPLLPFVFCVMYYFIPVVANLHGTINTYSLCS